MIWSIVLTIILVGLLVAWAYGLKYSFWVRAISIGLFFGWTLIIAVFGAMAEMYDSEFVGILLLLFIVLLVYYPAYFFIKNYEEDIASPLSSIYRSLISIIMLPLFPLGYIISYFFNFLEKYVLLPFIKVFYFPAYLYNIIYKGLSKIVFRIAKPFVSGMLIYREGEEKPDDKTLVKIMRRPINTLWYRNYLILPIIFLTATLLGRFTWDDGYLITNTALPLIYLYLGLKIIIHAIYSFDIDYLLKRMAILVFFMIIIQTFFRAIFELIEILIELIYGIRECELFLFATILMFVILAGGTFLGMLAEQNEMEKKTFFTYINIDKEQPEFEAPITYHISVFITNPIVIFAILMPLHFELIDYFFRYNIFLPIEYVYGFFGIPTDIIPNILFFVPNLESDTITFFKPYLDIFSGIGYIFRNGFNIGYLITFVSLFIVAPKFAGGYSTLVSSILTDMSLSIPTQATQQWFKKYVVHSTLSLFIFSNIYLIIGSIITAIGG